MITEDILDKLKPLGYYQTIQITQNIGSQQQDIGISFNPYGEVIQVRNSYLNFLIGTQKTVLEKSYPSKLEWTRYWTKILLYEISIYVVLEYRHTIRKLLAKKGERRSRIENKWIKELYQQCLESNDNDDALKWLLIVIEKIRKNQYFRFEPPPVVAKSIANNEILFTTPLLQIATYCCTNSIYDLFMQNRSELVTKILRSALKSKATKPATKNFICKKMNTYKYRDEGLVGAVDSFYHSLDNSHYNSNILRFLKRHKYSNLKEVAWEVFVPLKRRCCEVAFEILLNYNSQNRIYHHLHTQLPIKDKPKILRHALKFLCRLPAQYQIDSGSLLRLQILEEERYYPESCRWISKYFVHLLEEQIESIEQINSNISLLLNHPRARIRQAGVLIISELYCHGKQDSVTHFMERLLLLLRSGQVRIQVSVLRLFSQLNSVHYHDELIKLVRLKTQKNDQQLVNAALKCNENIKREMEY